MSEVSILSISKSVTSGITPLRSNPNYWESGTIPWLKTAQLGERHIYETEEKISQTALADTSIKLNPVNTISIAMYGEGRTRGNVSILKTQMATNQACCNIVIDEEKAYFEYVYYFLKTQYQCLRNLSSGVRKNLNTNDIKGFEIRLPKNLDDQKNIAFVLSAIDKKIELNNRISIELEAMAKLIYDYWFVQFDFPDEQGKPYKSSGGKMVFNEVLKREIPEGWEATFIVNILGTELGGTPSTKIEEYWAGNIPWLNSGEVATFPIIEAEEHITEKAINNSATSRMPKGTCVLSITRHLRPSILAVDACANQSVVGIYENEIFKSSFIYPYLKNEIPRLMSLRTGAQQPHINKGIVDASPIISPPKKVLKKYYVKVDSIYKQINNYAYQNKELKTLRDWLLPMLMNGQVTVR